MINLGSRSYKKELLDSDYIPFRDVKQNLKELNTINTLLGGHAVTVKGLKKIIREKYVDGPLTICEIGCGGGDNLLALHKWCRLNKIEAHFIGIDIKVSCIEIAKKNCQQLKVTWITNDYLKTDLSAFKPGIIFSSLFCHHFSEDNLYVMLAWMKTNSTIGFFINDLHRHPLAFYSIRFITQLFSKSYLVKNDAPLSVARGFTKSEWHLILKEAGIQQYEISWQWAFRHLIIYRNE